MSQSNPKQRGTDGPDEAWQRISSWLNHTEFQELRLTAAREKKGSKIIARLVLVRGMQRVQFSFREGKKESHSNLSLTEALRFCQNHFPEEYEQIELRCLSAILTCRAETPDQIRWDVAPRNAPKRAPILSHNRTKQRIIPEGVPCPFLHAIGVMTEQGQVKAPMMHKFRQINRFLEILSDFVHQLTGQDVIRIVDFGSGKSYLTFAIHYLFTQILNRQVEVIGLDSNPDVVNRCNEVREKLGLSGITFQQGTIAESACLERSADLVVSLHACDTATDDALAQAIQSEVPLIFVVPCCQHELASRIASPTLRSINKHGILKQRLSALLTDAARALLLEISGYSTQVVEFIDMEHTAKNVLIRARKLLPPPTQERIEELREEYRTMTEGSGSAGLQLERLLFPVGLPPHVRTENQDR